MDRWYGSLSYLGQSRRSHYYLCRKGSLHAVSSIDGEVLWKKDFMDESVKVQKTIQALDSDDIYVVRSVGLSHFGAYKNKINAKNGELLKHILAALSGRLTEEGLLVSNDMFVALDATLNFRNGKISCRQTYISDLVGDSSGPVVLFPTKLPEMFAVKINDFVTFVRMTDEGKMDMVGKVKNAVISDTLSFSEDQQAFAVVEQGNGKIHLNVKHAHDWSNNLFKESIVVDKQRGSVHKVFINNYIRTDRSHGFRALIVMEDHPLLLLQQGAVI